jgi:hypothetical protein
MGLKVHKCLLQKPWTLTEQQAAGQLAFSVRIWRPQPQQGFDQDLDFEL